MLPSARLRPQSLRDIELAKEIPELYPDLIEQGGLANALRAAMRLLNSSSSVSEFDKPAPVYACVELGERFSQVYIAAKLRIFVFDFWNRGVCLAHGITPNAGNSGHGQGHRQMGRVSMLNGRVGERFSFRGGGPNRSRL